MRATKTLLGQAFRSRMMRDYWADGQDATNAYKARVRGIVEPGMRILHAGCGWDKNDVSRPYKDACEIIGVDLDSRVESRFHSQFRLASLEELPFPEAHFDLIVSEYVFEHLAEPERALREMRRVLKPGGRIIILTPNAYSYKTLAARLTPHSVHVLAGRHRYGAGQEKDMYPTLYRCNSKHAFEVFAKRNGLGLHYFEYVTNGPTWFEKIPGVFELFHFFHVGIKHRKRLELLACAFIVELRRV